MPTFPNRPCPPRHLGLALIAAALLGLLLPHGALGQEPPAEGLKPMPLEVRGLGLRFHPPQTAEVVAESNAGQISVRLRDGLGHAAAWTMRIQPMTSTLRQPSPGAQVEDHLRRLQAAGRKFKVLENRSLLLSGAVAQLCYISLTERNEEVINGWFIVQTGEKSFVVFSIITSLEAYGGWVGDLLLSSFNTMEIRSEAELEALRRAELDAGRHFVAGISEEDLRGLVGLKVWFRTYLPGEAGTTERGISAVEVREAPRGALVSSRLPRDYDDAARQRGLMVVLRGRIVVDPLKNAYYDSEARYWLAWDRSEESWSILATYREGQASQSESETGVRTPPDIEDERAPFGTLTVIKSESTRRTRDPFEWKLPDVYLSQALSWVLGRLLANELEEPATLSWYFYNYSADPPRVSRRVDQWTRAEDGSGNWRLESRLSADSDPFVAIYDRDGALVRRTWADGTVTEPTSPEEIRRLWRAKNLRLGGVN